jgi:dTDP-4-amino-4,6-dideoxygalactose transaminase
MIMNNNIPFLDLVSPHQELKDELCGIFTASLSTAGFIGGPMVEQFERDFAAYCGTQFCVGVSNGTDALRFAMIAAGIKPGDRVVTVPNTFIATTEAISQAGAHPDFVDVDESTYNMDAEKLREYLDVQCFFAEGRLKHRRTGMPVTAVVPVHLYGQTADMDPILELANRYNLIVIEDACQAHGAEYFSKKDDRWKKAGSMGVAAAFSYYPGKNLGACGEAGAATTKDAEVARTMRLLRDHGQNQKYYHEVEGYNGRLDSIQAGILGIKLKHLPAWTEARRAAAARYRELLAFADPRITPPFEPDWARAVYHLFVVRVENRAELMKSLAEAKIGTAIHYPIPLHLQNAYKHLGFKNGDFPVAERVAPEILSLPMFPGLTANQQRRVVEEMVKFDGAATRALAAVV